MPVQIQFRRGTASEWTSANPTLSAGEVGFETDTNKFKLGTGSTAWTSLSYISPITASSADTLTNKTIAATSNTLTGVINNTLTSTTGDIIYASAANTPARLAAGTSGYVLTSGGASTAPSWAAPAGSGGWTLINSGGTALGSGTTTVSSIPGTYQELRVWVVAANPSAIDLVYQMIVNGDTGANYLAVNSSNSSVTNQSFGGTSWQLNINGISNDANTVYNFNEIVFSNYASTTAYKVGQNLNFYRSAASGVTTNWGLYQNNLAWGSASAITSVGFKTNGTGFTAGTIYVYGVK